MDTDTGYNANNCKDDNYRGINCKDSNYKEVKIHNAMLELSKEDYEVLYELYFRNTSVHKLAKQLCIDRATVRYRRGKALVKLKEIIEREMFEDDSFANRAQEELEEIKKKREELLKPKEHGWWYDEKTKCLIFQIDNARDYDIALNRLTDASKLLNFIFHLLNMSFINEKAVYEFLKAVEMLLNPEYNPLYNILRKTEQNTEE